MGQALLTLSAMEPDRDFIVIDEKPYFLRGDDELSLKQLGRIRRLSKGLAILGTDELTEEDMAKIEDQMNEILDLIVMNLPPELRDKLRQGQKIQIVRVFTAAAVRRQAATEKNPTTDV